MLIHWTGGAHYCHLWPETVKQQHGQTTVIAASVLVGLFLLLFFKASLLYSWTILLVLFSVNLGGKKCANQCCWALFDPLHPWQFCYFPKLRLAMIS